MIRWNQGEVDRSHAALKLVDNLDLESTLDWRLANAIQAGDAISGKSILHVHMIALILRDIGQFNTLLTFY